MCRTDARLGVSGGNTVRFCLGGTAGFRLPDEDMSDKAKLLLSEEWEQGSKFGNELLCK